MQFFVLEVVVKKKAKNSLVRVSGPRVRYFRIQSQNLLLILQRTLSLCFILLLSIQCFFILYWLVFLTPHRMRHGSCFDSWRGAIPERPVLSVGRFS